jgi:hypothetical protein
MNRLQPLNQHKKPFPELHDISPVTWWRLVLEKVLQCSLVCVLEKNIPIITENIATIEFYDAFCMLHTSERFHFLVVFTLPFFCWISLQDESIDVGIIRLLFISGSGEHVGEKCSPHPVQLELTCSEVHTP